MKSVPGVQQVENQLEVHHSPAGVSALQGGRPRRGGQFELMQENWSPAARLAVGSFGASLIASVRAARDSGWEFMSANIE